VEDNFEQFGEFMAGFAAAVELHSRATRNGSFVECICLGASIIDAMLRVGLILKTQLDSNSLNIPRELVLQESGDKAITERAIYRNARDAEILTEGQFRSLSSLYDERNRVIHRYVISRIATTDVLLIAVAYEKMIAEIGSIITHLEYEQVRLGVGMTVSGPDTNRETLEELADEKHAKWLGALLRGS